MNSQEQLRVWDTEEQKQCRCEADHDWQQKCQNWLLEMPKEQLTNWEWLPGEHLSGSEGPAIFLDMKCQTCYPHVLFLYAHACMVLSNTHTRVHTHTHAHTHTHIILCSDYYSVLKKESQTLDKQRITQRRQQDWVSTWRLVYNL